MATKIEYEAAKKKYHELGEQAKGKPKDSAIHNKYEDARATYHRLGRERSKQK